MMSTPKITPDPEPILQVRADERFTSLSLLRYSQICMSKFFLFCFFTFLLEEMWSEAIKVLKGEYTVRAIKEHKMDQAIVFCRTKIDCDNMEQYFIQQGGGGATAHGGPAAAPLFTRSHFSLIFRLRLQAQTVKATSSPVSVSMATESPTRGKTTWTALR